MRDLLSDQLHYVRECCPEKIKHRRVGRHFVKLFKRHEQSGSETVIQIGQSNQHEGVSRPDMEAVLFQRILNVTSNNQKEPSL